MRYSKRYVIMIVTGVHHTTAAKDTLATELVECQNNRDNAASATRRRKNSAGVHLLKCSRVYLPNLRIAKC